MLDFDGSHLTNSKFVYVHSQCTPMSPMSSLKNLSAYMSLQKYMEPLKASDIIDNGLVDEIFFQVSII